MLVRLTQPLEAPIQPASKTGPSRLDYDETLPLRIYVYNKVNTGGLLRRIQVIKEGE